MVNPKIAQWQIFRNLVLNKPSKWTPCDDGAFPTAPLKGCVGMGVSASTYALVAIRYVSEPSTRERGNAGGHQLLIEQLLAHEIRLQRRKCSLRLDLRGGELLTPQFFFSIPSGLENSIYNFDPLSIVIAVGQLPRIKICYKREASRCASLINRHKPWTVLRVDSTVFLAKIADELMPYFDRCLLVVGWFVCKCHHGKRRFTTIG